MIRFACPECGARLTAPPKSAGKRTSCLGCKHSLVVPSYIPPPEEPLDVLEVVEEEPLDKLEVVDDLPEVLPTDGPPRKKKRRQPTLIAHGNNGSVELDGHDLVFRHDGSFSSHCGRIRPGTYRHNLLGLTEIEFVAPGLLSARRIRFIFGNERLDADVEYVLDTQTIEFGNADTADFVHFKKEVERFKAQILAEIRMRR